MLLQENCKNSIHRHLLKIITNNKKIKYCTWCIKLNILSFVKLNDLFTHDAITINNKIPQFVK